mmetsp:Transcript_11258/g.30642  ORF Transcript_11258/g.30642 Transcript_11258/m.30642 type:complete len:262 (-) Transcript_11258:133-918(-)
MRALERMKALRRHVLTGAMQHRAVVTKRCLGREPTVPHHTVHHLKHGDLLFVSEPLNLKLPLDKAIQSVGYKTIDWLVQRGREVASKDTAEHVAMVVSDSTGHATSVVEAVRIAGTRTLPLDAFFKEFMPGTKFFHGAMQDITRDQARSAVAFAMRRAGAPYADDFAPPDPMCTTPWTQNYYCSSLIDYAYRDALNEELVFTKEPFPLIWDPPEFWDKFYKKLGMERCTGVGSNPTLLMHSPRVEYSLLEKEEPEEIHELF